MIMNALSLKKQPVANFAFCVLAGLSMSYAQDRITVFQLPKEASASPQKASVPHGWDSAPLGQTRVASFHINGQGGQSVDVSVIPLPGQAGRDLDNVNRWRGQVG